MPLHISPWREGHRWCRAKHRQTMLSALNKPMVYVIIIGDNIYTDMSQLASFQASIHSPLRTQPSVIVQNIIWE